MKPLYIILIIAGALLVLGIAALFIYKNISKKQFLAKREQSKNLLLESLGGKANIKSLKAMGSRLNISLNDYSLVNEDNLKKCGVSSIIKMSDKLTLVIGEEAKEIEKLYLN